MKFIYKFFLITFVTFSLPVLSAEIYFIDFSKVLNQSKAGAEAQKTLKQKFETESKKFASLEENIKKKEEEIISQKKILSSDDYKKRVEDLRKEVSEIQVKKQNSLNNIAKARNDARQQLLKSVNPILKKYMEENNIGIILDKQSIILGDITLEITDKIIEILNKELKSVKID